MLHVILYLSCTRICTRFCECSTVTCPVVPEPWHLAESSKTHHISHLQNSTSSTVEYGICLDNSKYNLTKAKWPLSEIYSLVDLEPCWMEVSVKLNSIPHAQPGITHVILRLFRKDLRPGGVLLQTYNNYKELHFFLFTSRPGEIQLKSGLLYFSPAHLTHAAITFPIVIKLLRSLVHVQV